MVSGILLYKEISICFSYEFNLLQSVVFVQKERSVFCGFVDTLT